MPTEWNRVGIGEPELNDYFSNTPKLFELWENSFSISDLKILFPQCVNAITTQEIFDYIIQDDVIKYNTTASSLFSKTIKTEVLEQAFSRPTANGLNYWSSIVYTEYLANPEILRIIHLTNDSLYRKFINYKVTGPRVRKFGNLTKRKIQHMLRKLDLDREDGNKSFIWAVSENNDRFDVYLRRDHRSEIAQKRDNTFTYKGALSAIVRFYKTGTELDLFSQTNGLNIVLIEGIKDYWLSDNQDLEEELEFTSKPQIENLLNTLFSEDYDNIIPTSIELIVPNLNSSTIIIKGQKAELIQIISNLDNIGMSPLNNPQNVKKIDVYIPEIGNTAIYLERLN